jgi:hypothetical protein
VRETHAIALNASLNTRRSEVPLHPVIHVIFNHLRQCKLRPSPSDDPRDSGNGSGTRGSCLGYRGNRLASGGMMATTETTVTCPFDNCKHRLLHYDIFGVPSPNDPLLINQTKNVYAGIDARSLFQPRRRDGRPGGA